VCVCVCECVCVCVCECVCVCVCVSGLFVVFILTVRKQVHVMIFLDKADHELEFD
jgi:hypothetical protein